MVLLTKDRTKVIDYPWTHAVIDNYLDAEDFNYLLDVCSSLSSGGEGISVYTGGTVDSDFVLTTSFLDRIRHRYIPELLEVLEHLQPSKVKLYKSDFEFKISKTSASSEYKVHEDHYSKLLSCVIYIAPMHSTGTFLHRTEDSAPSSAVEWRQNRAVFFSRKADVTWHSYKGDKTGDRFVVVFNLMANDATQNLILRSEYESLYGFLRFNFNRLLRRLKNKVTRGP